jgi:2-C-methyl-D-erythritol 4-phosphate cytidylyltransferase
MQKVIAIVPAAGLSRRLGPGTNKPFHTLLGKPMMVWTLEVLQALKEISEVIPVVKDSDMKQCLESIDSYGLTKVKRVAPGGPERQNSVYNGLKLIEDKSAVVLIHDGARPLVGKGLILDTLKGLNGYDGAVAALPPKDTIKEVDEKGNIRTTLKRDSLRAVQTPQVFPYRTIMDAHMKASREGFSSTDDSALVERLGGRIRVVMGSYSNIKITTPEDINIAEGFLRKTTDK